MNHKRGKPKSARAGCLMCKPHKHQRTAKAKRLLARDLRKPQMAP
jgi:hypothetical protein